MNTNAIEAVVWTVQCKCGCNLECRYMGPRAGMIDEPIEAWTMLYHPEFEKGTCPQQGKWFSYNPNIELKPSTQVPWSLDHTTKAGV